MNTLKKASFLTFIIVAITLSIYRIFNVNNKEIAWDVLGYYIPLPATFIYDDPLLSHPDWLKEINQEKKLTGTLYQISTNQHGEPMYFFFFGMAIFYLPFFFIGHFSADMLGLPTDGFSPPYQYALVIGGIIYMIIGLFYFRKILRVYFSEWISSIIMLVTVFSTNYIHHMTLKNLETVNILFMLVTIAFWFTMQWHKKQKLANLLPIGISIALITLVKPSEAVIGLLPLFWNVNSVKTARDKIHLIVENKNHFFITIAVGLLILSPQLLYWYFKTGYIIYDSYKNPGVGLDLFSPHIIDSLFSLRKGWLVYTPVMLFYLWGMGIMYKENKKLFIPIALYFIATFYIITSWSEWWYGAAFSNRPIIVAYPLLGIGFGYFLNWLLKRKNIYIYTVFTFIIAFTALNQFQWWQLKHYILDPYRTTNEYYWATFLKTTATKEDKKLLLVERDKTGKMSFTNKKDYHSILIIENTFENASNKNITKQDSLVNQYFNVADDETYALTEEVKYKKLTNHDHLWVTISFDIRYPQSFNDVWPCFVMTMDRKEGNYGYYAPELKPDIVDKNWKHFEFDYLTPPIRNRNDRLKYYFWKRGSKGFDIDNIQIEFFEKNDK